LDGQRSWIGDIKPVETLMNRAERVMARIHFLPPPPPLMLVVVFLSPRSSAASHSLPQTLDWTPLSLVWFIGARCRSAPVGLADFVHFGEAPATAMYLPYAFTVYTFASILFSAASFFSADLTV